MITDTDLLRAVARRTAAQYGHGDIRYACTMLEAAADEIDGQRKVSAATASASRCDVCRLGDLCPPAAAGEPLAQCAARALDAGAEVSARDVLALFVEVIAGINARFALLEHQQRQHAHRPPHEGPPT